MTLILELIVEFGLELVLQFLGEGLFELGFHSTAERLSSGRINIIVLCGAYAVIGGVIGVLSLYVLPQSVIRSGPAAFVYFVAMPLVAGLGLSLLSWLLNRGIRPSEPFELQKFAYGVLFAFAFAVTRAFVA